MTVDMRRRLKNAEKCKRYYRKHRDRILAQKKRYYIENRERCLQRVRYYDNAEAA